MGYWFTCPRRDCGFVGDDVEDFKIRGDFCHCPACGNAFDVSDQPDWRLVALRDLATRPAGSRLTQFDLAAIGWALARLDSGPPTPARPDAPASPLACPERGPRRPG